MADYLALAAQLRATRQAEQQARIQQAQQGGAATSSGGIIGQGPAGLSQTPGYQSAQSNQPPQQSNPLQQGLDAYNKYKDVSKMMGGGAGSSLGATGTAYAGSGLGGTGFGLGSSLVSGGASGAGSGAGLGSMLGSYGGASAAGAGAGGFGALGSTTAGGAGGLLSGAGATGGATLAGGGGAAGGAAAGGMGSLAAMGPWALLAAAIIGNESYAKKKGYRDEDTGDYMKDLFGGKVLEQDVQKRWAPKTDNLFGGLGGKLGLGNDQRVAADLMTGDFSNAFKGLGKSSLGKIFKIF